MEGSHRPSRGLLAGKRRLTPRSLWRVFKAAFGCWWADDIPRMGAALAYYTLFALAPVLIIVIAVGGIAFGADAVRGQIVGEIDGLVGHDAAQTIQTMLQAAGRHSPTLGLTLGGLLTFFIGATGAFLELQGDLNAIWRVKPKSRGNLLRDLLMQRVISFGLVLGFAFLLLTALVVSAALAALYGYAGKAFPGSALLWQGAEVVVSMAVITLLFALIFKVMPDVKLQWGDVWIGALVTAALFTVGKYLIGLYLGAGSYTSMYGTVGSVIIVLLWVYYSSQILLFGAEFTRAFVLQGGSPPAPIAGATTDRDAV
jgi:membrane protein